MILKAWTSLLSLRVTTMEYACPTTSGTRFSLILSHWLTSVRERVNELALQLLPYLQPAEMLPNASAGRVQPVP